MNADKAILIFLLASGFTFASASDKVREGNRLFEKKDYEGAMKEYRQGEKMDAKAPEIPFNIGNSFYREKNYQAAKEAYGRSLAFGEDALSAKAHYNIGNTLYREGDAKGALKSYKKALDLNPSDLDAKYNIEFLQKELKSGGEGASQKEKEEKEQKSEEQNKKDQKEGKSGQEKEQEEQGKQGEEQKQKEGKKDEGKEGEQKEKIPMKDADRILGALQGDEKHLPTSRKEENRRISEPAVDKDW